MVRAAWGGGDRNGKSPGRGERGDGKFAIGESFGIAISMMGGHDRHIFEALEHCYGAKCGKDAYLYYYDIRCCGRDTLVLPEDASYKVEIIDTWNMTRETVATGVSREVPITLPGRPYMAVLAMRD